MRPHDPSLPRLPYRPPPPPAEYRPEPFHMLPEGGDGMDMFRKLWRRRTLIAGSVAAGGLLAMAVCLTLTPRYMAETQVLIGVEMPNVTGLPSILQEMAANQEVVQSQSFVLQSRSIAAQVAHRLALDQDPEFNPRLQEKPLWRSWLDDAKAFAKDGATEAMQMLGLAEPKPTAPPINEADDRKRVEQIVASQVMNRVEVTPLQRSHVLSIAATSESPETAARLANTVANTYIEQQMIRRVRANETATEWLDQRIAELRNKVEASERATEEYRRQNGLFETRNDQVTAQQVSELNTQLILADTERASSDSRLAQAESVKRGAAPYQSLPEVVNSPLIQALRQRQVEVERQYAEMSATFGPQHPRMEDIRAQIKDIKAKIGAEVAKIAESLRHEAQADRARVASLRASLNRLQGNMGEVNEKTIRLRELERQAEADRRLLVSFLDRSRATDQQPNSEEPSSVVISEAAIPLSASFPPTTMLVLLGMIGGGLVGMMGGLLRENLDRTFRTTRQVEEATNLPVLGVLPPPDRSAFVGGGVADRPHTPFAQAVGNLYERLVFGPDAHAHKVVMVTSATPQEGKSRIAISLVRLSARNGLRVIILDCDWRRPTVHSFFGRSEGPGLGDLLAGMATPDEVVFRDHASGVHAIFAGDVSLIANTAERYARLRMLLSTLSKHYDLVVIDTPPVLAGPDTMALARMAEEIAFVIRWGQPTKDVVIDAIKNLTFAGGRFRGVILSDADPKRYRRYGMGDAVYPYPATNNFSRAGAA